MMEIYSEVVRDLLSPKADRKQGLEIRLDPKNGFYGKYTHSTPIELNLNFKFFNLKLKDFQKN